MPELEPTQVVWRKSRRSNPKEDCIEVVAASGSVRLRDSKNPHGPVIVFSIPSWKSFLRRARDGELDLDL